MGGSSTVLLEKPKELPAVPKTSYLLNMFKVAPMVPLTFDEIAESFEKDKTSDTKTELRKHLWRELNNLVAEGELESNG